jgi:hypothetical protein
MARRLVSVVSLIVLIIATANPRLVTGYCRTCARECPMHARRLPCHEPVTRCHEAPNRVVRAGCSHGETFSSPALRAVLTQRLAVVGPIPATFLRLSDVRTGSMPFPEPPTQPPRLLDVDVLKLS